MRASVEDAGQGAAKRWTALSERGSIWGIRATVSCHRFFGRGVALAIIHGVVAYFYATDRPGRRASHAYLRRVCARKEARAAIGRDPGWVAGFLHYRAFALAIADRIELWLGRSERFHFDVIGDDICDRYEAEGRGYIVLGAHVGSFDALRLLARKQKRIVNVLMFTEHAERINRVFRELSSEAGANLIPVLPGSVHAVFEIRERLRRGEVIAVLGDRIEAGDRGRSVAVPFLGDLVELPKSPFLMAALLGCPVVFMGALRKGRGRYEVRVETLVEKMVSSPRSEREAMTQKLLHDYAACVESQCVREPYQWFNFFDYWADDTEANGGA